MNQFTLGVVGGLEWNVLIRVTGLPANDRVGHGSLGVDGFEEFPSKEAQ